MASTDIGPHIGLKGVEAYQLDLKTATAATKAFRAELQEAAKIKNPFVSAVKQSGALESEINAQVRRVDLLAQAYESAVEKYGKHSKQAFEAQKELANAGKALKAMVDEYKKISTTKIEIQGVGTFKNDIQTLTQATKTFKAEFAAFGSSFKIGDSFKKAAGESESLKKAIETQKATVALLKDEYDRAVQEQGEFSQGAMELRERVANATTELNNMEQTLRDLPNGLQQAGAATVELGDKWKAVGNEFTEASKPFMGLTAVYGAGVAASVKVSADYEQAMAKVAAVSGFTEQEMNGLNDTLLNMSKNSIYAPKELAEGLEVLGRAGIKDTNDQITVLESGLALATAEGEDFGTMADGLVNVLYMYGMGAEEAGTASDILAQASRSANTNASYMFESLKYAGPMMSSLGFDLRDTALALDLMADNGIRGSQAGTGLRMALANLVSPTDKQAAAMEKFNISLDDGTGNAVSFANFLGQLRTEFGGLDADLLGANGELKDADELFEELSGSLPTSELEKLQGVVDIFGKRALPGMLAMINSSPERFDELSAAMENAGGTAQQMADIVADTTTGGWQKLQNGIQVLGIEIGEALLPIVNDFLMKASEWVNKFSEMDDGTKKLILTVGGVLAVIGPILAGIGTMTSGIGTLISAGGHLMSGIGGIAGLLSGGGGLISGIGGLIAAFGPFLLIAGLVVAAGVLIYKNWDKIKETAAQLKDWVVEKFTALKDGVVERFTALKEGVVTLWQNIKDGISNKIEEAKNKVTETVNAIKQGITDKFNAAKQAVTDAFNAIKNAISSKITEAKNKVTEMVNNISNTLKGLGTKALTWGRDMIQNFIDGIMEKWNALKDKVAGVAQTVKDFLGFSVPKKGPLSDADTYMPDFIDLMRSGLSAGISDIASVSDKLADAMVMTPTHYAELPAAGGATTNNNMGGVSIVINAAPGQDVEEIAEAVEERISNLMSRREVAYA